MRLLAAGALATGATVAGVRLIMPRRGRKLLLRGRCVRVIESGDRTGLPVVMIHGLGGQADNFARIFPLLPDYLCIAIDRGGAGWSDPAAPGGASLAAQAARVASIMDLLGVRGAVVVGHSLGATVALQLALDRPDLVAGLVTVGGLTQPDHMRLARIGAALGRMPVLREGVAYVLGVPMLAMTAHWLIRLSFSPEGMPMGFMRWGGGWMVGQPRAIAGALRDLDVVSQGIVALQPRLGTLAVPVAALHGRDDKVLSVAHAVHLAATVPGADLVVPKGGHMLTVTQPELVAEAIRRVWAAVENRTAAAGPVSEHTQARSLLRVAP